MSFLRHKQIYHPIAGLYRRKRALQLRFRRPRLMSLRPAIPWRVALLQSPPPLHQPSFILMRCLAVVNKSLLEGLSVGY
jgi:hypothetical protein